MIDIDFKKWLLWNAGGAATAIAILAAFVLLIGADISKRADAIENQKQELALRLKATESLVSLRAGVDQAGRLFTALRDILPAKDQLLVLKKQLELFARNNKLGLGFTFENEILATDTAPGSNNFTMSGSGSYANLVNFLKAVENSKYFVAFNFFDLDLKDKDSQMIIKGKVFSQ